MAKVRLTLSELFEETYRALYGERWTSLREALVRTPEKVSVMNPFPGREAVFELDAASLVPPRELDPQPGDSVLDLCAAPGGKSLMMLFASRGRIRLTVNELSRSRFQRLKAVLHDYLPDEIMAQVELNCGEGARFCLTRREEFDRVLVDAPCSGERHLLQSPQALKDWTPSRSKQLSVRQHSLLCAAVDACKLGGRIVYSTCAISPLENDDVIEKLLKSRAGRVEVLKDGAVKGRTTEIQIEGEIDREAEKDRAIDISNGIGIAIAGEPTEYGRIYLPDRGGAGPIYCAVLRKLDKR